MRHLDANEIPDSWSLDTLGDAAEKILGGGTPSKAVKHYYEGNIPWVTVKDLNGMYITDALDHITEEAISKSASNLIPAGNVLLATRMAVGSAHLNKNAVAINQDLKAIFPRKDVSPKYLTYWLRAHSQLLSSLGAGSTVKGLGLSQLRRLPFPKPPIEEQDAIVNVISSIDEALEAGKAVLEQLESVRESLLQMLLRSGIPGIHESFQVTDFGEVPSEWQVVTLQDVCIDQGLQTGPFGSQLKASEYSEEGIPVVMPVNLVAQHVSTNGIARILPEKAKSLERHWVLRGDVLFARRGDIGRFGCIGEVEEGWICGTGCLRARPSQKIDPTYLAIYLTRPFVSQWLTKNAVGQTMLNLNTKTTGKLPIFLPNLDEQQKMVNAIESFDERIALESVKKKKLDHVKQGLMHQLLTGKLRVVVNDG